MRLMHLGDSSAQAHKTDLGGTRNSHSDLQLHTCSLFHPAWLGTAYREYLGSFPSVAAAERLIGSTLSANTETVERVIARWAKAARLSPWLAIIQLGHKSEVERQPSSDRL
jgi:hypothetical protein